MSGGGNSSGNGGYPFVCVDVVGCVGVAGCVGGGGCFDVGGCVDIGGFVTGSAAGCCGLDLGPPHEKTKNKKNRRQQAMILR